MSLVLHGYWRSTAAYRVRIGLALKGLSFDQAPVNLLKGEQRGAEHLRRNPQGLTPALTAEGATLTQSLAILEWLEETTPEPPLLPRAPADRAMVRAMALLVAADVHPLNNLRVLSALRGELHAEEGQVTAWIHCWILEGFTALEALVAARPGRWCFGDAPTLADCCLLPQLYSARRFATPLGGFPRLLAVEAAAADHPAFQAAHPDRQPDAPQT